MGAGQNVTTDQQPDSQPDQQRYYRIGGVEGHKVPHDSACQISPKSKACPSDILKLYIWVLMGIRTPVLIIVIGHILIPFGLSPLEPTLPHGRCDPWFPPAAAIIQYGCQHCHYHKNAPSETKLDPSDTAHFEAVMPVRYSQTLFLGAHGYSHTDVDYRHWTHTHPIRRVGFGANSAAWKV